MSYRATNYTTNAEAPVGKWVCSPQSKPKKGPYASLPTGDCTKKPDYCGQCVSFVKTVCPTLPGTTEWKKGAPVKDNKAIEPGTVIATFDKDGKYSGHAAVFEKQVENGLQVYDQYITPPSPKAVGPRELRWGGTGVNCGGNYYVVE